MSKCIAFNILDMLKAIGEEKSQKLLSDFSSPLNEEVEHFVRNKSIEFAKKKLSITYLVIRQNESPHCSQRGDKNLHVPNRFNYTATHWFCRLTYIGLTKSETIRASERRPQSLPAAPSSQSC